MNIRRLSGVSSALKKLLRNLFAYKALTANLALSGTGLSFSLQISRVKTSDLPISILFY